jgi:hypothetical protein
MMISETDLGFILGVSSCFNQLAQTVIIVGIDKDADTPGELCVVGLKALHQAAQLLDIPAL